MKKLLCDFVGIIALTLSGFYLGATLSEHGYVTIHGKYELTVIDRSGEKDIYLSLAEMRGFRKVIDNTVMEKMLKEVVQ